MRNVAFLLMLVWASSRVSAQSHFFKIYQDSLTLKRDNNELIRDFEMRLQKINPDLRLTGLKTVIENNSPVGYYLPKTNTIYLPMWDTMPELFKEFGTSITGSKLMGDSLAKMYYYGYFLPHEIGHGLQTLHNIRHDNEYDNEYEANVIALTYWRQLGKRKEMDACYKIAKIVLKNLKNPIPSGLDPKTYFTEHYDEFVKDPSKYGYMMFSQIVKAMDDQTLPDFDNYIRSIVEKRSTRNQLK